MATSKSTVVGIRLDHDRRAWAEAEAARLGVSMRGLFEGMIDEARAAEAAGVDRAVAGPASAAASGPAAATTAPAAEEPPPAAIADEQPPSLRLGSVQEPSPSSRPGIGSVTTVPGGLIREALSLTTSLIELGGRCATKRLSSCVLTRRFVDHSA